MNGITFEDVLRMQNLPPALLIQAFDVLLRKMNSTQDPAESPAGIDAAPPSGAEENSTMAPKNDVKNEIAETRATDLAVNVKDTVRKFGAARIDEAINLKGSTYEEAITALARRANDLEVMVEVNETIVGEPLDAAIALRKALDKMYGWTDMVATPSIFGANPPTTITIETGVNETTQVPWGRIVIPAVDGYIQPCGMHLTEDSAQCLTLHGEVKRKFRKDIADLVVLAKQFLKDGSIFKGKAIQVGFATQQQQAEGAPPTRRPKFLDLSNVKPEEIIFSKEVQEQVEVSLLEPIEGTKSCEENEIPLKRTILLAGKYGVGKSLMLSSLGRVAPTHGWTYVHIDSVEHLGEAIRFAKQFEPAVLVAEDIDQVVRGDRDVDMNVILELIDGVTAKGRKLLIVLTTNHPELINPAMMRAGRIDAFINVTAPDAEASAKLVKQYARGLMAADENLEEVGKVLNGQKPSVIREVVERSKLAAQRRSRLGGTKLSLTGEDLLVAFRTMKPHLDLMEERIEVRASPLETHLFEMMKQAGDAGSRLDGEDLQRVQFIPPVKSLPASQVNGKVNTLRE